MPETINQLRLRLVELGCPARRLKRMVQEVADHRDDLVQAARAEGLPEVAAQDRADQQLGNPLELAGNLMVTLRRSSWWGRHFLFTFGFLPLFASPMLWGFFLWAEAMVGFAIGFGLDGKKLHAASGNPVTLHHLATALYGADYVAIALVALVICWLARRSGVSFIWMSIACAVFSFYALISYTYVSRYNFQIGISTSLHWLRAMIPLLVAGAFCLRRYWGIHVLRRQMAG